MANYGPGVILYINQPANERLPVIGGWVTVPDGTKYRIAAWKKEKDGRTFYSGTLETEAEYEARRAGRNAGNRERWTRQTLRQARNYQR